MKSIVATCLFFVIHFGAVAQFIDEPFFVSHYNDSNYVKNRGIYVTFSPISYGVSINTDNNARFHNYSLRLAVHWMTKNYQKFQLFAAVGDASKVNYQWMTTDEAGLMMGKIIHGRKRGFLDLNVGVAYFARRSVGFNSFADEEVPELHEARTVGIPFEAMAYTSKLPIGVGIGVVGNLNVNQPYINLQVQLRLGNPIVREHATLRRNRIVY